MLEARNEYGLYDGASLYRLDMLIEPHKKTFLSIAAETPPAPPPPARSKTSSAAPRRHNPPDAPPPDDRISEAGVDGKKLPPFNTRNFDGIGTGAGTGSAADTDANTDSDADKDSDSDSDSGADKGSDLYAGSDTNSDTDVENDAGNRRLNNYRAVCYHWVLVPADDLGLPVVGAKPIVDVVLEGPAGVVGPYVVLKEAATKYLLTVTETLGDGGRVVGEGRAVVSCRYVRRELRQLIPQDREAFLKAMREFYTAPSARGEPNGFPRYQHIAEVHNSEVLYSYDAF